MTSAWFVRFPATQRAALRLFCFPYAGGSAHLFRSWAARVPSWVEIVAVQAPGKGARALEAPHTSLDALVDDLLDAIRPLLAEGPFCFFGHSNGAMVSFELATRLQSLDMPMPERLLLSANPAPWTRDFERPYSSMDAAEFKDMLRGLNGVPPALLDHDELLEIMLPGLRADFALAESYRGGAGPALRAPATVFHGADDEIALDKIHAWRQKISGPVDFREIPGGHFFIHSHEAMLVAEVAARLGAPGGPGQGVRGDAAGARHDAGSPGRAREQGESTQP